MSFKTCFAFLLPSSACFSTFASLSEIIAISLIAKNALIKIRIISNGTCQMRDFAFAVTSSVFSIGSTEAKIILGPASSIIGLAPFNI